MVEDVYLVDGKRHERQKSPALSVTIISEKEAVEEAKNEMLEIRNRIGQLQDQTEKTQAITKAIQETIEKTGKASGEQARQLAELTAQQANQAAQGKKPGGAVLSRSRTG